MNWCSVLYGIFSLPSTSNGPFIINYIPNLTGHLTRPLPPTLQEIQAVRLLGRSQVGSTKFAAQPKSPSRSALCNSWSGWRAHSYLQPCRIKAVKHQFRMWAECLVLAAVHSTAPAHARATVRYSSSTHCKLTSSAQEYRYTRIKSSFYHLHAFKNNLRIKKQYRAVGSLKHVLAPEY